MRRIINSTLRIFVISAVLISSFLVFLVCSSQLSATRRHDMQERLNSLVLCIADFSTEQTIELLHNSYDTNTDVRVTFIDPYGKILYDNAADKESMENHLSRPEIQEALNTGFGTASRKSETVGTSIYYYAAKLKDSSVLRIAQPTNITFKMILSSIPITALIILILISIAFPVSMKLTRHIMEPVNNVDIDNIGDAQVYDELKPFFARIANENKEKAKAEKIRREFTANVSHELKTPLTTISGYAQMINNGMAKQEDIQEFGRKIEKEADRLLTLIDDIINLSNLDENKGIEDAERIDLSLITQESILLLEKAAKERNIQIFYSHTPAFINGNATLIGELVYNLIDNAVKYNKENGKINIFVGETVDGVELYVKDTGIGIPKEDTDRIFERFYRVDKSHSKKVGGTGLGLSIVKHVCACHNASIRVKSVVGSGTTMYVTFPNNSENTNVSA